MNNVYIPRAGKRGQDRSSIQSADKIFKLVESYFGLTHEELIQKTKKVAIVYPRQVCQWLMWKYSFHNARGIGILFDQNDNSSCLNSVKAIDNYISEDQNVKDQIEELEAKLKA